MFIIKIKKRRNDVQTVLWSDKGELVTLENQRVRLEKRSPRAIIRNHQNVGICQLEADFLVRILPLELWN